MNVFSGRRGATNFSDTFRIIFQIFSRVFQTHYRIHFVCCFYFFRGNFVLQICHPLTKSLRTSFAEVFWTGFAYMVAAFIWQLCSMYDCYKLKGTDRKKRCIPRATAAASSSSQQPTTSSQAAANCWERKKHIKKKTHKQNFQGIVPGFWGGSCLCVFSSPQGMTRKKHINKNLPPTQSRDNPAHLFMFMSFSFPEIGCTPKGSYGNTAF